MNAASAPAAPTARGLLRRRRRRSGTSARMALGVGLACVVVAAALGTMVFGNFDPARTDPAHRLLGVGAPGHLLGTDQLGRDTLARMLAGLRWSLSVGTVATCLVTVIGTAVGVLAGATQGLTRVLLTRFIDMSLSFPYLVLAITVMAMVGRGFWPLSLTLGLVSWPIFARVVYAETLGLTKRDFMLAARLFGVSRIRVIVTHVLPGVRGTLLVMWAFMLADLLVAESGLSFLGIGAPLGSPSLGSMLADGREYLAQAPRMTLVPGAVIVLVVVAANLVGDALAGGSRRSASGRGR